MNKFLIVALIGLSLAAACHYSCNCDAGSNVCNSCSDGHSKVDSNSRSCPCDTGYYTSALSPFTCALYIHTSATGSNISVQMDACHIEIGKKTKDIKVNTNCHYETVSSNTFVVS